MAYRHGAFVEQAIRSVWNQDVSGRIQLVVADDCSPDDTQAVIRALAADAPAHVDMQLVLRDANVGAHKNFEHAWDLCEGSYIALLEGDDFWTHTQKLAMQVSDLEENPAAVMSFTRVRAVEQDGSERSERWPPERWTSYDLCGLIRGNFAQTCSVVYRAGVVSSPPRWLHSLPMGDWPLHLLHALRGEVRFVDIEGAAYRMHQGGTWSGRGDPERLRASAQVLQAVAVNAQMDVQTRRAMRRRAKEMRLAALRAEVLRRVRPVSRA